MMNSLLSIADQLSEELACRRGDLLPVLSSKELFSSISERLLARSEVLQSRVDVSREMKARKANHFVIGSPEHPQGLEYEGVVVIGVSAGDSPPIDDATSQGFLRTHARHPSS